jgi:hypothetical protein
MNTRKTLSALGVLSIVLGLMGFAIHNLMGMHLSPAHNIIHLVTGVLALYFSNKGTLHAARSFSVVFGIIYALLGVIGLVAGGVDKTLVVIPNLLMFGTADNVFHIIVGSLFLSAGLARRTATIAY